MYQSHFGKTGITWYLIATAPAFLFFAEVIRLTPNIPYADDYNAILQTLIKLQKIRDWPQFLHLVTAQHNEHRIAVCKIVAVLDYLIFGEINFTRLALYGDLFLLGIALVMIRAAGFRHNPMVWLPVFLVIFGLRHYESAFWAMAALSNYAVIFFAFFAAHLLTQEKRTYFLAACLSAIAGTFSQGNGILVFPIGFIHLIRWKRYTQAWAWLTIFGIVALSYFATYRNSASGDVHPPKIVDLPHTLKFFFIFLGSIAYNPNHAQIIGAIAAVVSSVLAIRSINKKNDPFFLISLFILGTAAATSAGRVEFGVFSALSSRYSIYSTLILASVYLYLVRAHRYTLPLAVILACYVIIRSYEYDLPKQVDRYELLFRAERCGDAGYEGLFCPPFEEAAAKILVKSEKFGIYRLPTHTYQSECAAAASIR